MVVFGLIIVLLASYSEKGSIHENEKIGEQIINALYTYKQAHGVFPNTLNDLVPDYLDEIPKTKGGHDFSYGIDPYGDFGLVFKVDARHYCGTDNHNSWECSYYGE
jgi:hypothetical protein